MEEPKIPEEIDVNEHRTLSIREVNYLNNQKSRH
jgi:hypothetical protein